MKLKVSNVCQLLDKSKYPATITNSGVTFTNNGDGTITLNGTNTGDNANLYSFMYVSVKAGHYYYIYSGQEGRWENCMFTVNYSISAINVDGNIGFQDKSFDNCVVYLYIGAGVTFNNYIVKPQFFDLTEMYGAGHEPTTVAQFRQDFPNEMYDYSPECWKRFKELRYRTETKNLFDISTADITQHNGYWTSNANFTEHFYTQIVEPGKTYTVSYECYNPLAGNDALSLGVQTGNGFSDGTALYIGLIGDAKYKWVKQYREFTIPNGITQVTFSAFIETMFRNLQIEEGSTATSYQPYGYLPLRRGKFRTDTKNLFNLNCEWEYPLTTASELNLVVSGNTITGTALPGGAGAIISMDKIPITGDKRYYISGETNGHIAILLRLTDANGNVLTTNSDWDADYNSAYRAFYKYINSEVVITNANAAYIQVGLRFAPSFDGTGKDGDRISFSNVQFEIGSTKTSYQPYKHIAFH